ncbi:MAG: competence protein ComEC, partial [Thermoleophilaceae bacterium]|nr:competence protein ComEC [Thermoleophilaceae bacterium]
MSTRLARHPYHAALAAFAAGLALAPFSHAFLAAGLALAATGLVAVRAPPVALLALAAAAGGVVLGAWRVEAIDAPGRSVRPGERLSARATLLERPRPSRFGSSAPVAIDGGAKLLARAGASVRWPGGGEPGQAIQVDGEIKRPVRKPGAALDWPAYLRRHGIAAELALDAVSPTGARRGGAAGAVDSMRRRSESALARGLSPAAAALMRGMVLGEDEAIDPLVRDDFRRSGLAHLLAVSGQNVMLLCALALPLVAALRLGPRGRALVLAGLIAVYVPLAGAGPSLQRAGAMGAAGLAALAAGRPASRWYALLLAAAATLALNPRVAADTGWRLSFAAVAGIVVLGPHVRAALGARDGGSRGRVPHALAEGMAITVAATLATAPLMAHDFGYFSAAGLGANLLALPLVPPIMWLGMLEAALAQRPAALPLLAAPVDAACRLCGYLASVPLALLGALA